VINANFPSSHRYGRGLDHVDFQLMNQNRCTHNIDNGVHGPHLMKMHLLQRDAMNMTFRFPDFLEYSECDILNRLLKPGMFDHFHNVLVGPVIMMVVMTVTMIMCVYMVSMFSMIMATTVSVMVTMIMAMTMAMIVAVTVVVAIRMYVQMISMLVVLLVAVAMIISVFISVHMIRVSMPMAVVVLVSMFMLARFTCQENIEFGGCDPIFHNLVPCQLILFFNSQLLQLVLQLGWIGTCIDQCTDEHISANAGETIKIKYFQSGFPLYVQADE